MLHTPICSPHILRWLWTNHRWRRCGFCACFSALFMLLFATGGLCVIAHPLACFGSRLVAARPKGASQVASLHEMEGCVGRFTGGFPIVSRKEI